MNFFIMRFLKGYILPQLFATLFFLPLLIFLYCKRLLSFASQIQDHVEYMGSAARVILVPSIRDASHDFVFPQVITAGLCIYLHI